VPLMRYFGCVGSALLLLLFGLDWYFPQPAVEPVREQLPERVVIDTSLPTIAPPPVELEFAQRWPGKLKVVEAQSLQRPTIVDQSYDAPKGQKPEKSGPLKTVAAHRPAPPVNAEPASNYRTAPVTKMTLLDIIKERFGRSPFRLN
jgi:hypothetical protein